MIPGSYFMDMQRYSTVVQFSINSVRLLETWVKKGPGISSSSRCTSNSCNGIAASRRCSSSLSIFLVVYLITRGGFGRGLVFRSASTCLLVTRSGSWHPNFAIRSWAISLSTFIEAACICALHPLMRARAFSIQFLSLISPIRSWRESKSNVDSGFCETRSDHYVRHFEFYSTCVHLCSGAYAVCLGVYVRRTEYVLLLAHHRNVGATDLQKCRVCNFFLQEALV